MYGDSGYTEGRDISTGRVGGVGGSVVGKLGKDP